MNARFTHPSAKSHGVAAPPAPGATAGSAVLSGRAGCTVRELPGTPDDVAAWIDVHRPAALAGR